MGIKIKQIDGLQDAINAASGGHITAIRDLSTVFANNYGYSSNDAASTNAGGHSICFDEAAVSGDVDVSKISIINFSGTSGEGTTAINWVDSNFGGTAGSRSLDDFLSVGDFVVLQFPKEYGDIQGIYKITSKAFDGNYYTLNVDFIYATGFNFNVTYLSSSGSNIGISFLPGRGSESSGGATPYYPTSFDFTGAESASGGGPNYSTTIPLTSFGLALSDLSLGIPYKAGVQVYVNGVLASSSTINSATENVKFITLYPVESDDYIQLVILWDGIEDA